MYNTVLFKRLAQGFSNLVYFFTLTYFVLETSFDDVLVHLHAH